MASLTLLRLSLLIAPICTQALQVTPNSPCAAACQDSADLDHSDPNSSNTKASDITCQDSAFKTSNSAAKWRNCMSCLQNSTFFQGSESDQSWFLYNSRYAVSYCVFGTQDGTGGSDSPCVTPPACGNLKDSLGEGLKNPAASSQYGYCSVGGGATTNPSYESCLSCVAAGSNNQYVANYLVALEAGCLQKPAPGRTIGLDSSVFSPTTVKIVQPSNPTDPSNNKKSGLSSTMIAVVVVCSVAFFLILAALLFIRYRRRKNRLSRIEAAEKFRRDGGPQSPLSFQCRTHLGPLSPKFFPGSGESSTTGDRPLPKSGIPLGPGGRGSLWSPSKGGSPSFQSLSTIAEQHAGTSGQSGAGIDLDSYPTMVVPPRGASLHNIDTSARPSPPSAAHYYNSPSSATPYHTSPISPFPTPTSSTSARSTTQLLSRSSPSPFPSSSPTSPAGARAGSSKTNSPDRGWPL